jgi:hypothetical protein
MGKILALLGLHGLNPACVIRLKHDTGTIRGINERESLTVALQVAPFVDKSYFIQSKELRNSRNVCICQAHIALPPAARTTALASVNDGLRFLRIHISHGLRVALVICGGRT